MLQDFIALLGHFNIFIGRTSCLLSTAILSCVKIIRYIKSQSFTPAKLFVIPNLHAMCCAKFAVDTFVIHICSIFRNSSYKKRPFDIMIRKGEIYSGM
jgi:formate hydrogenlyase subunit 4